MNNDLTTPVITKDQARKITKGRTPLVPVEYEVAIRALTECTTLDESKYWSDKSDALAAWAKIYHSDDAGRKAKLLESVTLPAYGATIRGIAPSSRQ